MVYETTTSFKFEEILHYFYMSEIGRCFFSWCIICFINFTFQNREYYSLELASSVIEILIQIFNKRIERYLLPLICLIGMALMK